METTFDQVSVAELLQMHEIPCDQLRAAYTVKIIENPRKSLKILATALDQVSVSELLKINGIPCNQL